MANPFLFAASNFYMDRYIFDFDPKNLEYLYNLSKTSVKLILQHFVKHSLQCSTASGYMCRFSNMPKRDLRIADYLRTIIFCDNAI